MGLWEIPKTNSFRGTIWTCTNQIVFYFDFWVLRLGNFSSCGALVILVYEQVSIAQQHLLEDTQLVIPSLPADCLDKADIDYELILQVD